MTVQKPRGGYKPGDYHTVGHCAADGCGLPMLSKWAWQAGIRRADHGCTGARGMCRPHYARWSRSGSTVRGVAVGAGSDRKNVRSREEVLEEYALIRDDVAHIRQAAERLGDLGRRSKLGFRWRR